LRFRSGLILDLCCGGGRITRDALRRGAKRVIAIEECPQMLKDWDYKNNPKITVLQTSVQKALRNWDLMNFGKVRTAICQQAVNYWLNRETAVLLHKILEEDGTFSFNTFVNIPSRIPQIKTYSLNEKQYTEITYIENNDLIHHVQICEGLPPHTTSFQWLSAEKIQEITKDLFSIHTLVSGPSIIYHCSKLS